MFSVTCIVKHYEMQYKAKRKLKLPVFYDKKLLNFLNRQICGRIDTVCPFLWCTTPKTAVQLLSVKGTLLLSLILTECYYSLS